MSTLDYRAGGISVVNMVIRKSSYLITMVVKCNCCAQPMPKFDNESSAVAEMDDRGQNNHGPKRGGCCAPLAGVGAGSLSNTMWPGPRST